MNRVNVMVSLMWWWAEMWAGPDEHIHHSLNEDKDIESF